ncbi:MAG: nitrile hydratase accessory protein [Pseudohongiellaceae bacterium]|jgi:nitrile hydratase accessory protein|nr:nitrile hydratase accessory protein [Gammaproteobacteria bacterium]
MSLFPDQPAENGEPVFKEPWEAQAFSLVIALHESGVFSWDEWSDALAQAIRRDLHPGGGEEVVQRVSEAVAEDAGEDVGEEAGKKTSERMAEKEDRPDSYYQHWLAALEHLAIAKGLSGAGELAQRVQAWREAYLATPHGQPVELACGQRSV